jgi:hypothetical protein
LGIGVEVGDIEGEELSGEESLAIVSDGGIIFIFMTEDNIIGIEEVISDDRVLIGDEGISFGASGPIGAAIGANGGIDFD